MRGLEERLGELRPRSAPPELWDRLLQAKSRGGRLLPAKLGGVLAAGGMIALLIYALWEPGSDPLQVPAAGEGTEEMPIADLSWLDRTVARGDLPRDLRIQIEEWVERLASEDPHRQKEARRRLEFYLEYAAEDLEKALRGGRHRRRDLLEGLLDLWEWRRADAPLAQQVAALLGEGRIPKEWLSLAQHAIRGDSRALERIRDLGKATVPAVAHEAEKGSAADRIFARALIRELLGHEGDNGPEREHEGGGRHE